MSLLINFVNLLLFIFIYLIDYYYFFVFLYILLLYISMDFFFVLFFKVLQPDMVIRHPLLNYFLCIFFILLTNPHQFILVILRRYYNVLKRLNQVIGYRCIFNFFYHKHVNNCNLACFYIKSFSKNICNILLFHKLMLIYDICRFNNHLLPILIIIYKLQ